MIARLRVRRSRLARISRWLGVLSIPILVITALAHRAGVMEPIAALMATGVGFSFAFFAVLFAVFALVLIWHDGRLGARDAIRGLIYGTIAMIPLGFVVYGILSYPNLNDVSTDIVDPPAFTSGARTGLWGANATEPPSGKVRNAQRKAYPDIVSRRFPLTPAQMFAATKQAIDTQGWEIIVERPPEGEAANGHIEAVSKTLLFALPDDIAVRILPDPYGARLDIRSSSRYGRHDIGTNARRIRAFFETLDEAVLEVVPESPEEDGEDDQSESQ